ncbi:MAG: hypothetical protein KXJ45_01610 [Candidatus Fonsibacter sp.]|jgi:hypothetical protein|nr:hypothetical protein [Candidatus Fonsibacter sp.]
MLRLLIYLVSYILFPTIANTHVQHYKNLQRIEFDIYRNNDLVGYHKVNVKKKGDNTKEIITDILIEVKILGIKVHTYKSYGVETYKNEELIEFKSKTQDGSDNDYCNIKKISDGKYSFDGMTENKKYIYELTEKFYPALWWNHDSLLNNNYVLGQGCRNLKTKITFLNKETKKINDKNEVVNFYNIKGDNLDINIGYTEKDLKWVDMKFTLKGDWEYKLKNLN